LTAEIMRIEEPDDAENVIARAAEIVQGGGVIVYPTDTSYGLGCDARNPAALKRLLDIKGRTQRPGVPLLFNDLGQCERYHEFGSLERVLVRLFWPGALTLLVKARPEIPEHMVAGLDSIALRVPDHAVPRGISRFIDGPLVGTSANRTGGPSPFDVSVAIDQLSDEVDLYIDGGPSSVTNNSTIISVEGSEADEAPLHIKVYREGALSIDRLTESLSVDADAIRYWSTRFILPEM
jgi:L-threonylcarbamoyladenylate synthase